MDPPVVATFITTPTAPTRRRQGVRRRTRARPRKRGRRPQIAGRQLTCPRSECGAHKLLPLVSPPPVDKTSIPTGEVIGREHRANYQRLRDLVALPSALAQPSSRRAFRGAPLIVQPKLPRNRQQQPAARQRPPSNRPCPPIAPRWTPHTHK